MADGIKIGWTVGITSSLARSYVKTGRYSAFAATAFNKLRKPSRDQRSLGRFQSDCRCLASDGTRIELIEMSMSMVRDQQ